MAESNQMKQECDPNNHSQSSKELTVNPPVEGSDWLKAIFVRVVRNGFIRHWPQDMTPSQFLNLCEWAHKPMITLMAQQICYSDTVEDCGLLKALFVRAVKKRIISLPDDMTPSQFINLLDWAQKPLITQPAVMTQIHGDTSNGTHDAPPNETITSSMARKVVCKDPFNDLEIGHEAPKIFNCVVYLSKGIQIEYPKGHSFMLPYNKGYIPRTIGEDNGQGMEVLVIMQEPVVGKCYIRAKAIGFLPMLDPIINITDNKIIAVCADDPEYRDCNDIKELPPHQSAELHRFTEDYKKMNNPTFVIDEFLPATKAYEAIQHSMNMYAKFLVNQKDYEEDYEEEHVYFNW